MNAKTGVIFAQMFYLVILHTLLISELCTGHPGHEHWVKSLCVYNWTGIMHNVGGTHVMSEKFVFCSLWGLTITLAKCLSLIPVFQIQDEFYCSVLFTKKKNHFTFTRDLMGIHRNLLLIIFLPSVDVVPGSSFKFPSAIDFCNTSHLTMFIWYWDSSQQIVHRVSAIKIGLASNFLWLV